MPKIFLVRKTNEREMPVVKRDVFKKRLIALRAKRIDLVGGLPGP
jgi:hypothetical protein